MSRHTFYNKHKRDTKAKSFYNSKAWEVCRTKVLVRDFYLCRHCLLGKTIKPYDVVHHIKPLRNYPKLALTESNLISLCHRCHNEAESGMEINKRNVNVIEFEGNPEII